MNVHNIIKCMCVTLCASVINIVIPKYARFQIFTVATLKFQMAARYHVDSDGYKAFTCKKITIRRKVVCSHWTITATRHNWCSVRPY